MIYATSATTALLASLRTKPAGKKLARSLAADRYVDFPNGPQDNEWRRRTSAAIKDGAADPRKLKSWQRFVLDLAGDQRESSPRLLFARQESRLLVNMAGGVFENGGLSLDRISGIPFIPGSAVKGCARRAALAALQEWTSGELTSGDPLNLLTPAINGMKDASDLLIQIALVFGWSDVEWKGPDDFRNAGEWERKRSDFAWACGDTKWESLRRDATARLCTLLRITLKDADRPWKSLPHFAGTVAFVPAYPWEKDPGIELDLVTCHHGEYYRNNPQYANAPDIEEPVPVIFPAVAPRQTWTFVIHPTPRADESHLAASRTWLALGLEAFGIGGKTNAGYGWFDASDELNLNVKEGLARKAKTETEERERKAADEREAREAEQRRKAKAALEAMTPDERIATLTEQQFDAKICAFWKEPRRGGPSEEEKKAIVTALKGPRIGYWQDFKVKASNGGDLAKAEHAIRALNKQLNADKMP